MKTLFHIFYILFSLLTAFNCNADTIYRFKPSDDLTVFGQNVNNGPYLELAKRSVIYMKFNIENIKGKIVDVRLELKANNNSAGKVKVFLGSHNNWDESNVTDLPLTGKAGNSLLKEFKVGETVSLPLKDIIKNEGIYTLIIKSDGDSKDIYSNNNFYFYSKENRFPPTLIVTSTGAEDAPSSATPYSCKGDFKSKKFPVYLSMKDNALFLRENDGLIEMETNPKENFNTVRLNIIDINGKDLEDGDQVYIQTYRNNFLFTDPGTKSALANNEPCIELYKFTIKKLNIESSSNEIEKIKNNKITSLDKVAFQTSEGTYLTTDLKKADRKLKDIENPKNIKKNNKVTSDSTSVSDNESFTIHFAGKDVEKSSTMKDFDFDNTKSGNLYEIETIENVSLHNGRRINNKKTLKADNQNYAYLKFNLSGANISGIASGASLKLHITGGSGQGVIKIYSSMLSDWKENEITLSKAPPKSSQIGKYEGSFSSGEDIFVFLDYFQFIYMQQKTKTLIVTMEGSNKSISFSSRNSDDPPVLYLGTNGQKIIPSEILEEEKDKKRIKVNKADFNGFIENNGKVTFEAESIDFTQGWIPDTLKKNYTGQEYYQWKGKVREEDTYAGNSSEISGVLTYPIRIKNPGSYYIAIRTLNPLISENGYVYVSANQNNWVKILSSKKNQWDWSREFYSKDDLMNKPYEVKLEKGINYISVTGGSKDIIIDRIFLYKGNNSSLDVNSKTSRVEGNIIKRDYPYDSCFLEKEGTAEICGEVRQWHPISFTFESKDKFYERDKVNPFLDIKMEVNFEHKKTKQKFTTQGFFAADGKSEYTGAESGKKWRSFFTPELTGEWSYKVSFKSGKKVAISGSGGRALRDLDGKEGKFFVLETNKSGKDFRSKGILRHGKSNYFKFSNGNYFFKNGIKTPVNFLSYYEFDNIINTYLIHKYISHQANYKSIGPLWGENRDKGKNIMGAINYLNENNVNSLSFTTYNIEGGLGNDVFIWSDKTSKKQRIDVSKLAQWEQVFMHMQKSGIAINFILQMPENDHVLDKGKLETNRKLYYREMVARFSHHPALIWNLGERVSMGSSSPYSKSSVKKLKEVSSYLKGLDPYHHPIILNAAHDKERLYTEIIAENTIDGISFESKNKREEVFKKTNFNIKYSDKNDVPRAVFIDKILNNKEEGLYKEAGVKIDKRTIDFYRREAIWGNLMAKGSGMDLYLSNKNKNNITSGITIDDFIGYESILKQTSIANIFFEKEIVKYLPQLDLCSDIGNANNITFSPDVHNNYCLGIFRKIYILYFKKGWNKKINNLPKGIYSVKWYNPLEGEKPKEGNIDSVEGKFGSVIIGTAPFSGDSIAIIKR